MTPITRRNSMAGLLGVGAAAALPCGLRAAEPAVLHGAALAQHSIDSGGAEASLDRLIAISNA